MNLETFKKHVQESSTGAILDTLDKLNTKLILTNHHFAKIIFEELEKRDLTPEELERFNRLKPTLIIDHSENDINKNKTSEFLFNIIVADHNAPKFNFIHFCIYAIKISAILFLLIWIPLTLYSYHYHLGLLFTRLFAIIVLFFLLFSISYLLEYTVKSHSTLQQLLKDRDQ